jgi:hypothetical protein
MNMEVRTISNADLLNSVGHSMEKKFQDVAQAVCKAKFAYDQKDRRAALDYIAQADAAVNNVWNLLIDY